MKFCLRGISLLSEASSKRLATSIIRARRFRPSNQPGRWIVLRRRLTFTLFDDLGSLFLRCSVSCDRLGYMVEKEFYMDLPESTDPTFLWRILGDLRFTGNPPSLTVQRSVLHPEVKRFFWIKFQAGEGFDSGPWEMHGEAIADIKRTIKDACEMYEASMVEGFQSLEDVDRFLEVASRSFESS